MNKQKILWILLAVSVTLNIWLFLDSFFLKMNLVVARGHATFLEQGLNDYRQKNDKEREALKEYVRHYYRSDSEDSDYPNVESLLDISRRTILRYMNCIDMQEKTKSSTHIEKS